MFVRLQVMDVVGRYKIDMIKFITRNAFVLTHNRFESPEYIFETDHVTLMTLEDQGAIFVEALPGQELWRTEYSGFFRLAQVRNGTRNALQPTPIKK